MDVLSWWNLVFLLPAAAALLYLVLLATGTVAAEWGGPDLDLDLDADGHAALDFGADHDLHAPPDQAAAFGIDHVADTGGGVGVGVGAAAGANAGTAERDGAAAPQGGLLQVLSLFGVGKVPLSLLLTTFFLLWGFLGWVGNQLFAGLLASPAQFIWPSLALALVGGAALTRALASGLGRVMPTTESFGASHRQLVGRLADVRYAVSEGAGSVQVLDAHGTMHEVPARVRAGDAAIPAGRRVVIWRYDEPARAFLVTADEVFDALGASGQSAAAVEPAERRSEPAR